MYLPTGFTIGNHLLYNYFMPDTILTKEMLARSRVIAKGRAIREVERLLSDYTVARFRCGSKKAVHHWKWKAEFMSFTGMSSMVLAGLRSKSKR